ncbi:hypothetical protein F4802DRAFT_84804 [Xylaria palmicola]|nr:hypothetical protein F4802DRAFT_84804 [Xylaria palmicola]
MRVRLGKTKTNTPVEFGFYEEAHFAYCPVTAILALGIADNAFLGDIDTLERTYSFRVSPKANRQPIAWKEEWIEAYIFRKMGSFSEAQACQYGQAYNAFKRYNKAAKLVNTTGEKLSRDTIKSTIQTFHKRSGQEEIQR